MSPSKIEWTEETWNPTTGCSKVSPGCAHCYAETLTKRYAGANGWPAAFLPWTPANVAENVVLHPERLEAPLHWKTPRRVFVNSMSDLFHEQVPDEYIDRVFAVMALTPQHTYQVLTKRPERMRAYMTSREGPEMLMGQYGAWARVDRLVYDYIVNRTDQYPNEEEPIVWPRPNVWLGVTVENQRWADERIPILLDTPAAVRFLSCEPLLAEVDLIDPMHEYDNHYHGGEWDWLGHTFQPGKSMMVDYRPVADVQVKKTFCKLCGNEEPNGMHRGLPFSGPYLDWVIVGGESGPSHRPFDPAWARSIVAQCREAAVACFVKQLGGARPGNKLQDLPEDLRVREFPL